MIHCSLHANGLLIFDILHLKVNQHWFFIHHTQAAGRMQAYGYLLKGSGARASPIPKRNPLAHATIEYGITNTTSQNRL